MTRDQQSFPDLSGLLPFSKKVEGREWWLWGFAVAITLVLTFAIISLTFASPDLHTDKVHFGSLKEWVRGLTFLILLFDLYTIYQHAQLQRMRRRLLDQHLLFQLITENAADMIAVIDMKGRRIYNSPAYEKVLGYSISELQTTSSLEQVHPEDRTRVAQAADNARLGQSGATLEYRIRHKDGSWRVLESTANVIRSSRGEVAGLVIVNRDITERKCAEDALARNAFYDGLTGLANRTLLLDRIARVLSVFQRHPTSYFAALSIDMDGFRVVNDSLGYAAGDILLTQIAQRLSTCLRTSDTVSRPLAGDLPEPPSGDTTLARPGGDEFVVLADELKSPGDAIYVAERILSRLGAPFELNGHQIVLTASVGIALSGNSSTEPHGVLRDAEIAMYRAKTLGKARWEVFNQQMHAGVLKRLELEGDMRKAIELGEFKVHYQPIVSLESGRVVGFETLSRWQRPLGMVMPGDFIPIADETGLIIPINRQLLSEACCQLRVWQQMYPADPPLFMSINVSSKEFLQADLTLQIGRVIRESKVDPRCLCFEITETIAMADAERSAAVLSELKQLGVSIDIDDFGTGYSSLSRLQSFRVDTLKVDRAFVSRIDTDRETHEIVRIIVMLAHSLGLHVVAEGVETPTQLDLLRQLGCENAQGYLFSKPSDPETIERFLATNRAGTSSNRRAAGATSSRP
ncbi:MAG TPA: EAL domain-containing protein [Candidatus Sulfotelmatobacter sp.]|jgi:PAS domain S-box-containing protein